MGTRVLLLRHAQSEWNASGRWQGWADPGLSPQGAAAAAAASSELNGAVFDAVVSSDLRRATETAAILAGGGPVTVFRGLRERGAGEFTGLTRAEIEDRWPGALTGPGAALIPGGEDPRSVLARAVATLHRLGAEWPASSVLAVSHGALIRLVEAHLGGPGSPVPNLAGRWVEIGDGSLALEEAA